MLQHLRCFFPFANYSKLPDLLKQIIRNLKYKVPVCHQLQCQRCSSQTPWGHRPLGTGLYWRRWADRSSHTHRPQLSPAFSWWLPSTKQKILLLLQIRARMKHFLTEEGDGRRKKKGRERKQWKKMSQVPFTGPPCSLSWAVSCVWGEKRSQAEDSALM